MELIKAAILFLVGVGASAAFYVSGWDRSLPHWLHLSRDGASIHLAISPGATSGSPECPPGYAIDNRTDHAVFLTLAEAGGGYAAVPSSGRDWNHGFDHDTDHDYDEERPHHASFEASGAGDAVDGPALPDSAEPGVNAPDDSDPGASNYGGSSPDFRDSYAGGDRSDGDGAYGSADDYAYDERSGFADSQPAPYSQNPPQGNSLPPPSASGPIPLTPQYGSPYDSSREPVQPAYGPSAQTAYGPAATRVRPGEVFFASSGNPSPRCGGAAGTVTLQLSE